MDPGHGPQEPPAALRQGHRLDRTSTGRKKRVYDQPATPYARLLASGALTGPKAQRLAEVHQDLNPAAITRKINTIQSRLLDSARERTHTRAQA